MSLEAQVSELSAAIEALTATIKGLSIPSQAPAAPDEAPAKASKSKPAKAKADPAPATEPEPETESAPEPAAEKPKTNVTPLKKDKGEDATPTVEDMFEDEPKPAAEKPKKAKTIEHARAAVLDVVNALGRDAAFKLLQQYGAEKVGQIKSEQYADLCEEAANLIAEAS